LVANAVTQFISMLISFYFVVYVVVLVFLYYDETISKRIETKNTDANGAVDAKVVEGESISDNSDSGSDSLGEEQSGDSDSKEP